MFWNRLAFLLSAFVFALVLLFTLLTPSASAQTSASAPSRQGGSSASAQPFDVKGAVNAYLAKSPLRNGRVRTPTLKAATGCCCGISCPPFW